MSTNIGWKDTYSIGIKEIDTQHKKFFGILARADDTLLLKKHEGEPEVIIKELFNYADYHFSVEERYFEKFNYPEKDIHVREHAEYRKKTLDFYKQISSGENIYAELIDFIYNWWVGHIMYSDRKYIENFKEHGIR